MFAMLPNKVEAQSKKNAFISAGDDDGWTTKCEGDSTNKCRSTFTGMACYSSGEGTRCKSHSSTSN